MRTKSKNKLAGIILAFCALTIIISAVMLKNSKDEKTSSDSNPVASFSATSSATSGVSAVATSTAKSSDPLVYTNTDYGFEVTFPASMKDYAIETTPTDQIGVIAKYSVLLPTSDKNFKSILDSKAIAMEFYIYDPVFWAKPEKAAVRSSEITKNDKYVYTYSTWEGAPSDLKTVTDKDFVNIIKTFKLTGS